MAELVRNVSDTARWVATYRAEESTRRDALFRDPLAERLAGELGREIANRASPHLARTLLSQPAIHTWILDFNSPRITAEMRTSMRDLLDS